ncbi:MAG: hypothetical protein AAB602_03865 [Patescibacteria group bacterium]
MNKTLISVVALLAVAAFGFWFLFSPGPADGRYDAFAQCLASKGITMYGADWCPHCQNEKKAFGSSFKFVPYVECPSDPQKCLAAGINGYPTWMFPDPPAATSSGAVGLGWKKLEGEQGLEKLSQESGCTLQNEKINPSTGSGL